MIEKSKLHISRRPTFLSWLLLLLSGIFFIDIFRRLTDNYLFTIVALMGETMFGLDALARWEHLTLDRDQNAVIASQCTWVDKLMARNPKINTIMKLSDVRHVGVSKNMGMFFVSDDGQTVGLDTRGLTRNEIQNNRKLINRFIVKSSNANTFHHRSSIDDLQVLRSTLEENALSNVKKSKSHENNVPSVVAHKRSNFGINNVCSMCCQRDCAAY